MIDVSVTGTLPQIETDLAPIMTEIQEDMTKEILLNFTMGGRPTKWAALKAGGASHLTKSGFLKSTIKGSSGMDGSSYFAQSGTSKAECVYAAVHEFGWPAKNVPQRAYVMFQQGMIDKYKAMLLHHIITFKSPIPIGKA